MSAAAASLTGPISVILGRFDPLVQRGIFDMLREDPQITVVAEDLDEFQLGSALTTPSPVVLLDEAVVPSQLSRLRTAHPGLPILVLARQSTPVYGRTLLAFGVSCLDWAASPAEFVHAVRQTYMGRTVLLAGVCRVEHDPATDPPILTDRELAILTLLSQNESYQGIALRLGISASTVRAHTAGLRGKLKAKTRRELRALPVLA